MEYDIIEKVSELSGAQGLTLEDRLGEAANLLLEYLAFDSCLLYLDDGAGALRLRARAGRLYGGESDTYLRGEGLAWKAIEEGRPVEVVKDPAAARWAGGEDSLLVGARHALAMPLAGSGRVFGAACLRSSSKVRLSLVKRRTARVVALEMVSILRCSELARSHSRVYGELVDMQKRLIDSEKLLALGDMAATMAHEIRNPLLSIGAYASRLRRQLPPGAPGLKYLDQMSADIARIEKIMNGIIRFLRDNAVELRAEDLNSIIDEALTLFSDEFSSHGIGVTTRLTEGALEVMADREQMKIAFDNLIANAIQSMGNGGTLSIETSLSGGFAIARLKDTGGGIDPRYLEHIFNPFFTTKKHGTGLGLPIANSIVTRHKGRLEAVNEGPGAVFTVSIPYAGADEKASTANADGAA